MRLPQSPGRLVGRDAERATLAGWLRAPVPGGARCAVVVGEAGIGKSALVASALDRAGTAAGLVLAGGGVDIPGVVGLRSPFGVFAEVVRALARAPQTTAQVQAAARQWLAPAPAAGRHQLDPAATRQEDLLTLLEAQGEHGPVTVVLEDLHWADEASLSTLVFLTRHLQGDQVRLVATARPAPGTVPPAAYAQVLGHLGAQAGAVVLELKPLRDGDIRALLGPRVGSESAARVIDLAEGNPLAALELASAADGSVPPSIDLAVRAQLARLPAPSRELLAAAAVIGDPVPHPMLRELVGPLRDGDWETARDAALASGLLQAADGGYSWWHALHRRAVYGLVDPGHRADLHASAAGYLEKVAASEGTASVVAAHWDRTPHRTRAAAAHLRAGLEASAQGAFSEAAAHLETGIRTWAELGGEQLWETRPVIEAVRDAVRATGQAQDGINLLMPLLPHLAGDDLARAWAVIASLRFDQHDQNGAWDAFDRALAEAVTAKGRGHVLVWRSAFAAVGDVQRVAELAQRGLDEVGPGDSFDLVLGLVSRSFAHVLDGDTRAVTADLGRAGFVAARLRDERAEWYVLQNALASFSWLGMPREGLRAARSAIARARGSRLLRSFSVQAALGNAAELLSTTGHWDEVLALTREVWGEVIPDSEPAVALHLASAEILTNRGDAGAATPIVDHLAPVMGTWPPQAAAVLALRARLCALAGERDAALDAVADGFTAGMLDRPALVGPTALLFVCDALSLTADLAAEPELRARARDMVSALERARAALVATGGLGQVALFAAMDQWASAEVARARGHQDPVAWWRLEQVWTRLANPYRTAYLRFRRAEALIATGDRRGAARPLAQALGVATALDARPLREDILAVGQRARLELGASSSRVRPGPQVPEAAARVGLTRRECDVLEQLVDGRSDRQIARVLGISERTVGVHVSHVLAKLAVTSRGEAAAVAHRSNLLGRAGKQQPNSARES